MPAEVQTQRAFLALVAQAGHADVVHLFGQWHQAVFQRDIRVENIASLRVSAAVMGALLRGWRRLAQVGINMGVTLGTAGPRVDFRLSNSA